jgi:hypothetical protein
VADTEEEGGDDDGGIPHLPYSASPPLPPPSPGLPHWASLGVGEGQRVGVGAGMAETSLWFCSQGLE